MDYQFKEHPIHKGYLVSLKGEIFSHHCCRQLKPMVKKDGYHMYWVGKKWKYAHRLVMETYKPREGSEALMVNHKDFNRGNNHIDNLEWCTQQENIEHSRSHGRLKNKKGRTRKGYKASEETRLKHRESKLGERHPRFKGYYITPDGQKHASIGELVASVNMDWRKAVRFCKEGLNGFGFEPVSKTA